MCLVCPAATAAGAGLNLMCMCYTHAWIHCEVDTAYLRELQGIAFLFNYVVNVLQDHAS